MKIKNLPHATIKAKLIGLTLLFLINSSNVFAQGDSLITILSNELDREFAILSKLEDPVYYMDYHIRDDKSLSVTADLGSLSQSGNTHSRVASVNIRIGAYQKDNTHESGQIMDEFGGMNNAIPIPLENNEKAIAQSLWILTDLKYREAEDQYSQVKSQEEVSETADFSEEEPEVFIGEVKDIDIVSDQKLIEENLKSLSALFLENEDIVNGTISLNRTLETKYFVSSEGSRIVHQLRYNFLIISATIRDSEGELIPLYQTYFAFDDDGLPEIETLKKDIGQIMSTLVELQSAPFAEPYTGPAILHPRAAGVFFHEIFGHRIEGSRLNSDYDSQTFMEKVGEQVLPKSISVYMDPTIDKLAGQDLLGYYLFDDEGVRAQRVKVVEHGILRNFLMTRTPLEQFPNSNGHARTEAGYSPVSRQSNLIVEAAKQLSEEDLRKQLLKECKNQKKEYGYYFMDVQGGFTNTDRFSPNAFNIMPTLVYRVFVDGRPDQLVRGVNLIGTPLSMFAEIKAASQDRATFNGFCGAESGSIPVSATAPGLLVRRIETQKKFRMTSPENTPLLSRPQSEN